MRWTYRPPVALDQPVAKPRSHPVAAQVIVPRPTQPHPCGRPIDGHTPVVVGETGPLVPPLAVATVAPTSSDGGLAEVKVGPTLATPI